MLFVLLFELFTIIDHKIRFWSYCLTFTIIYPQIILLIIIPQVELCTTDVTKHGRSKKYGPCYLIDGMNEFDAIEQVVGLRGLRIFLWSCPFGKRIEKFLGQNFRQFEQPLK